MSAGVLRNIPFPRQSPLSQLRIEIAGRARVKGSVFRLSLEVAGAGGRGVLLRHVL